MSISSSPLWRKNSFEKRAPAQIYFGSNSLQKTSKCHRGCKHGGAIFFKTESQKQQRRQKRIILSKPNEFKSTSVEKWSNCFWQNFEEKKNSSGILSNSGRDHFQPTYSSLRGCQITSKTVSSFFFLGKKFVSKKFELTGLVEHGLGILGKCVLVHQNVTGLIVKKWLENNWTWKNVLTTCFEQRPNHFWESCWNCKNSWSYDQKINQVSQLQIDLTLW